MKIALHTRTDVAMTLLELMVVVVVLAIGAALLLPALSASQRMGKKIRCDNNLKQVGLAFRIWEGDNGDIYPQGVSVTNGGAMEMVRTGDVVQVFAVMSNELSTPIVLVCPSDQARPATNFKSLASKNISYFAGVAVVSETNAQAILCGDSNFEVNRKKVGAGLVSISTNDLVLWATSRHDRSGNLCLADGSAQGSWNGGASAYGDNASLSNYFIATGVATNQLAIP